MREQTSKQTPNTAIFPVCLKYAKNAKKASGHVDTRSNTLATLSVSSKPMASTALHVRPPPHRLDDNKPPSSRFRIACDARLSGNVRSTFTNDFPAHDPTLSRRDPMKEPEPAHIMHSDAASQQRGESITRETYNAHAVNRPHFKSSTDGYATNFKMHADKSIARKFNFRTTHGDEFRSRDLNAARQSMNEAFSSLKSCFPQGDKSKEKTTRSEYGNSFRGEAGNVAVSTQNRWNVQNTICGA